MSYHRKLLIECTTTFGFRVYLLTGEILSLKNQNYIGILHDAHMYHFLKKFAIHLDLSKNRIIPHDTRTSSYSIFSDLLLFARTKQSFKCVRENSLDFTHSERKFERKLNWAVLWRILTDLHTTTFNLGSTYMHASGCDIDLLYSCYLWRTFWILNCNEKAKTWC